MEKEDDFGLSEPIMGKTPQEYMTCLIERNEQQEIDLARSDQIVKILKQKNNHSRLMLEAAKFREARAQSVALNKH